MRTETLSGLATFVIGTAAYGLLPATLWSAGGPLCFGVLAVLGLVLIALNRGPRPAPGPFLALGIMVLLLAGLNMLAGGAAQSGLHVLLSYAGVLLLYPTVVSLGWIGFGSRALLVSALLAAALYSGYLLVQHLVFANNDPAPLGYGTVSGAFNLLVSAAILLAWVPQRGWHQLGALVGLFAAMIGLILFANRASILAFTVTLIVAAAAAPWQSRRNWVASGGLVAVLLAVPVLAALLLPESTTHVLWRFEVAIQETWAAFEAPQLTSMGVRIEYWLSGIAAFVERPLTGWGLLEHAQASAQFRREGAENFPVYSTLHNEFIVHAAAFGFAGLLFMFALFGTALWAIHHAAMDTDKRAGILWLSAGFVFLNFDIALNYAPTSYSWWFLTAYFFSTDNVSPRLSFARIAR
ncbi:O-antigen ligase family protein [Mesorhizobium sp. Z1-4]|uniref:O-antigen ligase family protein n=1 Tax=Mesorhizobium sp. Z1-4 TaxID=2448478 RepID=UPI000FD72AA1|nr:O-antigen ligase family protein [Mesorhizobium sp. Z1-4]